MEIAEARLDGRRPTEPAFVLAGADADLTKLKAMVRERRAPKRTYTVVMTPVVGAHGGPGTLGMALYAEDGMKPERITS